MYDKRIDIKRFKAEKIFDQISAFAGYGFNKSHAAAYALIAYQCAWLKTHYPHEFFASLMTYDSDNIEKLSIFADELKRPSSVIKVLTLSMCLSHTAPLSSQLILPSS